MQPFSKNIAGRTADSLVQNPSNTSNVATSTNARTNLMKITNDIVETVANMELDSPRQTDSKFSTPNYKRLLSDSIFSTERNVIVKSTKKIDIDQWYSYRY